MPAPAIELWPLPGLEVVGRGISLRPHQTYELKGKLFPHDGMQPYRANETKETYGLPFGYEVNSSPPIPDGQSLNHLVVEESWERFSSQFHLDAQLAVSSTPFTVDASGTRARDLRREEECYYALRSSLVPLWTVYLTDTTQLPGGAFELDIPVPFNHAHRAAYDKFFARYGTHFVTQAWVGGKAVLTLTVSKSSAMDKSDIVAGLKANLPTVQTNVSRKQEEARERLQKNAECTVFGKGGEEVQLAALSSLDEVAYNNWLASIKANPQVVDMQVQGIWTLVPDPDQAETLKTAYAVATTSKPLRAVFSLGKGVYFVRGDTYTRYDFGSGSTARPKTLLEQLPVLDVPGFSRIDAVLRGDYLVDTDGTNLSRKLFVFHRDKYLRFDPDTKTVDEGYPKLLREGFPGIPFERIDAVINSGPDDIYFFSSRWYVRFSISRQRMDEGYPDEIIKRWVGVTFDRIDAAIYWGNGKVYFFRGEQHIRYDMVTCQADAGYPKSIIGSYVEDWKFFD